jgi:putative membrane protein
MFEFRFDHFLNAVIYAGLGVVIFALSFVVIDKLTPGELWDEVVVKQNRAVATLFGLMFLAVGIIIAAAIH